jgi:hypothetical protein
MERESESGGTPQAAGQPAPVDMVRFHASLTVKPGYGQPGGPGGDRLTSSPRIAPAKK